ncbi:hypothetical protein E3N88_33760 [Mikania micrantha]|uniref:Uncharacterized protein n=1 Tax=Mikania micrantha TaxID=192012 RepID=A0A5N6MC67_9ASTR|nr:hypothetical protein E3N88_33760 [Mikania micrantha]
MPYDFSIVHRAGKLNRGADALSRRPSIVQLCALVLPKSLAIEEIISELQCDPFTQPIIQKLLQDPDSVPHYQLLDQVLHDAHDTPAACHEGFLKTYKRILVQFFWPHLKQDVRSYVQNSLVCQQQKYETLSPAGLLQPLLIPHRVWEDISTDFIVGLPKSNRFDTIFVVVDRLSKYSHFLPMSHPFTAKAELFRLGQTSLKMSTSYHLQTDGQTEVVNHCVEAYLRCFAQEQPQKWSSFLAWAEYSYNTGYHSSLRSTPFKVVYGRDPPLLQPYVMGDTNNADFGPYLILKKIGKVAYKLSLPPDSRIHQVFHVSLLKPARGVSPPAAIPPLPINQDWELVLQPSEVLAHCWRQCSQVSLFGIAHFMGISSRGRSYLGGL